MHDKELLELAAKAAGYEGDFSSPYEIKVGRNWVEWNPLTNDGDALRLAVKLNLFISRQEWSDGIYRVAVTEDNGIVEASLEQDDPYTATRRAIVRAAAGIGKEINHA